MTYCKDCVKTGYCFDLRKSDTESIACHKFQDKNYKNYSRDSDCDAVTDGAFGDTPGTLSGVDHNRKARDIDSIYQNKKNQSADAGREE